MNYQQTVTNQQKQQPSLGRVGVLYGGCSAEREISIQSGNAVIAALQNRRIETIAIDTANLDLATIQTMALDRVFIALHGAGGEDGTWQGALGVLGIPYTGSGVLASALAMDKVKSKQLWQGVGLPTAPFCMLQQHTDWQQAMAQLGGKAMVKPACEGSSIGMCIAASADELEHAWQQAVEYDSQVIAEQWLSGSEYTVAILDDQVLAPIKLETDRQFYDFEAKYQADDTRYLCPCGLDEAKQSELQVIAKQAFLSLGCEGWGRVDLMVDEDGEFQILEVNTVPGMTSHSLVPMAAKAAGIDFEQLVLTILSTTVSAGICP